MPVLDLTPDGHSEFPGLSRNITVHSIAAIPHRIPTQAAAGPGVDPAVLALMKAHPALGTLSDQDRRALAQSSKFRFQKRQDVICRQGEPASSVVLVLDGYVKLSVSLADGGEVFIDIARPGDCLNEMLALRVRTHDASVTALSPCRLLLIEAQRFRQAFHQNTEGLLAILRLTDDRLQRLTEQLVDSRARTAPARLAKALLRLTRLPSIGTAGGTCLPLRISQGELSIMAGMSREIVNKHLGAWRDAGWIEMSGGTVASVDVMALSGVSGDDLDFDIESIPYLRPARTGASHDRADVFRTLS
jgi:CRP-like cAMP-binding protein